MTKNTLMIISGMLFIAMISVILSLTFNLSAHIIYLIGLLLWMLMIPVYYKVKNYIIKIS